MSAVLNNLGRYVVVEFMEKVWNGVFGQDLILVDAVREIPDYGCRGPSLAWDFLGVALGYVLCDVSVELPTMSGTHLHWLRHVSKGEMGDE